MAVLAAWIVLVNDDIIRLFDHCLERGADGAMPIPALPPHGGVYLVADSSDRPILLSMAENLRRAVAGRLSPPNDAPVPARPGNAGTDPATPPPSPAASGSRRLNLAEIASRVYWRPTHGRFETALAHWEAARALNPRTYRSELSFGPSYFLRVDPGERLPRFTASAEIAADAAQYTGPFATRRDTEGFIQVLEDAFDLCRYHHVLEQAPHGQACAYFEMGRCPAPCDGSIPLSEYRSTIAQAAAFAAGDHQPQLEHLRGCMQRAAADLQFEKAAALRQTIERAESAVRRVEHRFVDDLSRFRWLVIQRAGPRRTSRRACRVRPYWVNQGALTPGEPVAIADLEAALPLWLDAAGKGRNDRPTGTLPPVLAGDADARRRTELIWLVSRFLFMDDRAPGLFLRCDRLPSADALHSRIVERFMGAGRSSSSTADAE